MKNLFSKKSVLLNIALTAAILSQFSLPAFAATNSNSPITTHLQQLEDWLNKSNTGSDYINRNLSRSTAKAKAWNQDFQVQEVNFAYNSESNFNCTFTFSIRTDGEKLANSKCPANTLTIPDTANLTEVKNSLPISGITASPKIKLHDLVNLMLQEPVLQSELVNMLMKKGSTTGTISSTYKLYVLTGNIVIWEVKIKNAQTGKSAMVQARANSEHPLFYLKAL